MSVIYEFMQTNHKGFLKEVEVRLIDKTHGSGYLTDFNNIATYCCDYIIMFYCFFENVYTIP